MESLNLIEISWLHRFGIGNLEPTRIKLFVLYKGNYKDLDTENLLLSNLGQQIENRYAGGELELRSSINHFLLSNTDEVYNQYQKAAASNIGLALQNFRVHINCQNGVRLLEAKILFLGYRPTQNDWYNLYGQIPFQLDIFDLSVENALEEDFLPLNEAVDILQKFWNEDQDIIEGN